MGQTERESSPTDIETVEPWEPGVIGISQYSRRDELTRIRIPEGVRRLDDYAFYGCDNLEAVELPDTLTEIGEAAFAQCGRLAELRMPAGVRVIGRNAFADCGSLRSVELPETYAGIAPGLFVGCHSLAHIGTGAAYRQDGGYVISTETRRIEMALPTAVVDGRLELPQGTERIAPHALSLCPDATKVAKPDSIVEIDGLSFGGLPHLAEIETRDGSAFRCEKGCLWRGDTIVAHMAGDGAAEVDIDATGGHLAIGPHAFRGCLTLREVRIHAAGRCAVEIGEEAFEGCENLETVSLPEGSATTFGVGSFRKCGRLRAVEACETAAVGDMAFEMCASLTEAPLSGSTTEIGVDAFAECTALASITIPTGVKGISDGAFANCSGLESVDFHDDVETIGEETFYGCTKLRSVDLPMNLRSVGGGAFACSGLESVAIPRNVETVGGFAFGMCRGLEAATMPSDLLDKAGDVFAICPRLEMMGVNHAVK